MSTIYASVGAQCCPPFLILIGLCWFPYSHNTTIHTQLLFSWLQWDWAPMSQTIWRTTQNGIDPHFDCCHPKFVCGWLLCITPSGS